MSLTPPIKLQELQAALHAQAKAKRLGLPPPAACESVNLLREPDAANPHVRFDEREVETEHGEAIEAPATERPDNG